ncbi:MAG: ParB/RepB/Spo0J family partition protein [Deltaproteobacteria bacterium]|nr:ParB/RepB/Spo0J family partition protein [Deltaproteobacteria bacterium]
MQNRALGKGLASLLPVSKSQEGETSGHHFLCVVENILPSRAQPRKLFNKKALEELAESIKEQGLIQPLIVRAIEGGKYELIAGERRLRASKLAGLEKVPVVVSEAKADQVLELALIENIQREDLNPIEEALAYQELQQKYGFSQEELASRVGKDRSTIANTLRLLGLPEAIRADIIEGRLSMGHARALLSLESDEDKLKLKKKVLEQALSVRDLEQLIRHLKTAKEPKTRVQVLRSQPQQRFLEERLSRHLGTKVKIKSQGQQGKVVIEFYSPEDLDRIYNTIIV